MMERQNTKVIPNLLFYSKNCRTCDTVIRLLQFEKLLQYFNCICVDNNLDKIPKQITHVPTIIIPSLKKPLVANEIFAWIQAIKASRKQNIEQQNNNILPVQINTHTTKVEPIGFVSQEMAGLSDTYAYTMVDAVPQHNYVKCTDVDKNVIFTAPEKAQKINGNSHQICIDEIEKRRKEQDKVINDIFTTQKQNITFIQDKSNERDKIINTIVEKQQQNIMTQYS